MLVMYVVSEGQSIFSASNRALRLASALVISPQGFKPKIQVSTAMSGQLLLDWARSLHRKGSCSSRTLGDDMLAARCLMQNS